MLDKPMQLHRCSSGPPITVQIYAHGDQITQTVIYPHSEEGIYWQMIADHPYPELESKFDQWFKAYCMGKNPPDDLNLKWEGLSPFTIKVLHAIQEIPFGQVKTYQELAEMIGEPKGARAVGGACGRNPFPWIIPCHRVTAAGNRIGGFSLDILIKRHLLEFEGVHIK